MPKPTIAVRGRPRRGSHVFDHELDWYFNYSEGEMGKRAAFVAEPMGASPDADDRRCDAATKERRIVTALSHLESAHRNALCLSHRVSAVGFRARWENFGENAAVIVGMSVNGTIIEGLIDERAAVKLLKQKRVRDTAEKAKESIRWLRDEANGLVRKAVQAYRDARRSIRQDEFSGEVRRHEAQLRGAA